MRWAFLREGRRLALGAMHLLGSRTLVALGLLLAILTGAGAVRNLWLWRTGATVQGVVVRQLEELAADWTGGLPEPLGARRFGIQTTAATRVYRAVVEFQAGGASYEVIAGARATVHLYPLGSKVDVVFPPGRPERARLRPELPDIWVQAGLLFLSTVVGAGSGYTWWKLALRRAARRRVVKPAG
ncbi:MAG TPA: hypothetical protein VLN08_16910 [Vicinamibacterales bacterium]|nr:hypothetical protein [Vicinamibacterales bacterium]